jgi:hypothetical protein
MEMFGQFHASCLTPREIVHDAQGIGGWVGPITGMDAVEYRQIWAENRTQAVQLVARRYNHWTIRAQRK